VLYYANVSVIEFFLCGFHMSLTTKITLLEKISSGDEVSWETFRNMYAPLIRNCGIEWHLTDCECDELIQDVMVEFFKQHDSFCYDRLNGRFRDYLCKIARDATFALLKRRKENAMSSTNEALMDYAWEEKWHSEWRNYLYTEALRILQGEMEKLTFESFRRYVLLGQAPCKVAEDLNITVNAVYVNKCRTLDHLRRIIKMLDEA
jgi:RNA polymerase sigma factor (sigma-70 family)